LDIMAALRRLPPTQRAAVYLHYQADLPVREVARLLGTNGPAVRVRLMRGRRRLAELLGEDER
jgi:RNA polymerase sigma-70 factor, ECF subfamily